jgi:hypothetical protein
LRRGDAIELAGVATDPTVGSEKCLVAMIVGSGVVADVEIPRWRGDDQVDTRVSDVATEIGSVSDLEDDALRRPARRHPTLTWLALTGARTLAQFGIDCACSVTQSGMFATEIGRVLRGKWL